MTDFLLSSAENTQNYSPHQLLKQLQNFAYRVNHWIAILKNMKYFNEDLPVSKILK